MKLPAAWALLASALAALLGAAVAVTPVARAVALIQGLQEKLEGDLKTEEGLFEAYYCWYKKIVDTKTASNAKANSRIDSLESYIADIEAGRIEFTTERVDLEKQVKGLQEDLQIAEERRTQENQDFEAAKREMLKALAALGEAIQVVDGGMTPSLAQAKSVRWSLDKALQFGRGALSADDTKLLQSMIQRDVPTWDWKKLNRKATFKKQYAAQSGGILKTLEKLEETFSANLEEAEDKESKAQASYDALKTSKTAILDSAQQALVDMVAEGGARQLSKDEAQSEVDALKQQVADDTRFIQEAEDAYAVKKQEWEDRKVLRQKEISEMSKALVILADHDNRHVFEESFKSQGYTLLQESQAGHRAVSRHNAGNAQAAIGALRALAATSKDPRLALLAASVKITGLEKVLSMIDALIATLASEEAADLQKKESCEAGIAETANQAKTISRDIDGLSDDITRAMTKVEELKVQIKEQEDAIAADNETITELVRRREDEAAQYEKDKATDLQAAETINSALAIVESIMSELSGASASASMIAKHTSVQGPAPAKPLPAKVAGLASVARRVQGRQAAAGVTASVAVAHGQRSNRSLAHRQTPAGEAPPPPPSTWAEPYTGAQSESNGIVAILSLIKDDVEHDMELTEEDEKKAIAEFEAQKADLEAAIQAAEDAIADLDASKATEEQTIVDKSTERLDKKGALKNVLEERKAYEASCDYLLVNFEVRIKKRQVETDGLLSAKTILLTAH